MEALITVDHGEGLIDASRVERLIAFAADQLELPDPSEVSVTFVTDEEMARLNEGFRGKQGPTDVLSFECDNLDDGFPQEEGFEAGDIIIAPDVAAAQASELGHALAQEIDTLLVHGLLHLIGYDHIEEEEAQVMEGLQEDILASWRQGIEGGR